MNCCERFENHIAELLEGEIEAARRQELMEHIEACEGCREELRALMPAAEENTAGLAGAREAPG